MTAVLPSEWTELLSVRSTWWCTAVYLLVVDAVGWRDCDRAVLAARRPGRWLATRTLTAVPGGVPLAVPTRWAVGLVVCGAWTLGAWAVGAVLLERRDVQGASDGLPASARVRQARPNGVRRRPPGRRGTPPAAPVRTTSGW